ncbi:peptidase S8/S53 domain-containing protein [Xylaria telfairii]|nr:peptidase S8/S53 domain-containing protein [Xylaria telfairii]
MSREDALKALYKVDDERVIEFDLSHLSSPTIDADFLRGLAKVLRFETVLGYVALPRLSIQDDKDLQNYLDDMKPSKNEDFEPSSSGDGKNTNDGEDHARLGVLESAGNKGKGLTTLYAIFQWLRNLNVSSIIKITVIDDVEPSHSDAAIEACLEGFSIEKWNWKKFDICSDVILKAAPNVKHVTLYSSGNKAVLLGWASTAGLCKLKRLESVYVVVREGLESKARLSQYLEEFTTTLKSHEGLKTILVECTIDDPKNSLASVFVDKDINPENNPWLQYMKNFGRFLQNVKPQAKPISIAVIDDGINTKLDTFTDKIHCGDSFYDPALDTFHGRRGVYYVPSGRHGTLMAQLICNSCPVVKLFVAQLQITPGREQQRSFTTRSAIKAIEWAVTRKVDIISMSWSIDEDASDASATGDLNKALSAANDAGILMFCSCIDQGATLNHDTLPGRLGYCIRIGAARSSGEKLPWVAGSQSQYLLPGDNIKPEEPDAWSHYRSGPFGSSIATALATGLAAALLYCDRLLKCPAKFKAPNGLEVDYLRNTANMRKVFDSMSTQVGGGKFVEVRNTLAQYLPEPNNRLWNTQKNNPDNEDIRKELQGVMDAMKRGL